MTSDAEVRARFDGAPLLNQKTESAALVKDCGQPPEGGRALEGATPADTLVSAREDCRFLLTSRTVWSSILLSCHFHEELLLQDVKAEGWMKGEGLEALSLAFGIVETG